DSAAARFADRNAGGYSKRNSRTLGHLCYGAVAAELSFSIPQTILWLDTTFHRPDLWPVHVCWRDYYRGYDFADHRFGLARDFAQRAEFATRSGLWARRHSMGSDAYRSAELCEERLIRRGHSRSRTSPWRNASGHDGHRQHAANCGIALQAGVHASQRAGQ